MISLVVGLVLLDIGLFLLTDVSTVQAIVGVALANVGVILARGAER